MARIRTIFINLFNGLKYSIKRFPVTVVLAWTISLILLIIVHIEDDVSELVLKWLQRIIAILFLGLPISLTIHTIYENNIMKLKYIIGIWLASLTFLIIYLFIFLPELEMIPMIRYFAISFTFWAIFISVPYFFGRKNLGVYSLRLAGRMLIVMLYGLVIWGGLSLTLLAFEKLMNVNLFDEIYIDLFIIIAGIFLSLMFLAGLPSKDDKIEVEEIPKIFRTLLIYAVMPILSTYTLILYIYSIKLLVNWSIPDGIVGNLVIWYALIGTLIMFITHRIQSEYKWSTLFAKWFPRVILLPMALLLFSLQIRISIYGITETRYFMLILSLWIVAIMIYYSITPYAKRKMVLLPLTLGLVAVLIVSGPWNMFNSSVRSQNNRFNEILVNNEMLIDDEIIPNADIDAKAKEEITGVLEYFDRFHELNQIEALSDEFIFDDMEKTFGFAQYSYYGKDYIYINAEYDSDIKNVSGYDYFISNVSEIVSIATPSGEIGIEYSYQEDSVLTIFLDEKEIFKKDLMEYVEIVKNIVVDENIDEEDFRSTPREKMTFIEENDDIMVKTLINSITISENDEYFSFDLMIKIK